MAQFHSPLCEITWTEVLYENQRFVFQEFLPLELRFGLKLAPDFWSSSGICFIEFNVFDRYGELRGWHQQEALISELRGAPSDELWLGMKFGQARDVADPPLGWGHRVCLPATYVCLEVRWRAGGAHSFCVRRGFDATLVRHR